MILINVLLAGVAVAVIAALGAEAGGWLPWRSMAVSLACLIVVAGVAGTWPAVAGITVATGLAAAVLAAALVMAATWWGSPDLRRALAR
jgi:putative peptidoglycan lipid II flippase